jgi:cytochrome b561
MAEASAQKYTKPAIWLHWLIGVAIIAQVGIGLYMVDIPKETPGRSEWFNFHKSLGLSIALFVLLRIWWRLGHAAPNLAGLMPDWQHKAAKASHWLLYVCMVAMPASGYIASSFSKFGVKFWGIKLPSWGWEDKALRESWVEVHEITMYVLVTLIAIHIAAALKHLIVDKDGIFQRMLP